MTRTRTIAIGAFGLVLATAPFLPRGGGNDGSLMQAGQDRTARPALTAGPGELTPELSAEIARVVDLGRTQSRLRPAAGPAALASALVRCADFEGQRYCLHTGWTTRDEAAVRADVRGAVEAAARPVRAESTGDLDLAASLQRAAALSTAERAARERAELTEAARSVAKVWLLRHQLEGVALPADFLARHPEARAATSTTSGTSATAERPQQRKTRGDYPRRSTVMRAQRVSEQQRSYWCGPATMQMIAWGWKQEPQTQTHWADKLRTTTSGTAISDMVRVTNATTGWDDPARAGRYVVLDIGQYSYEKWLLLNMRHVEDYRAPLVLHPVLEKRYYPYLDDDASGHFQVGRGYDKRGGKPTQVGYFEPWNQQRFDPSEPYIHRVQWRSAYKSYRANQAHFLHNIGV